jgi:hypothetical protein
MDAFTITFSDEQEEFLACIKDLDRRLVFVLVFGRYIVGFSPI